MNLPRLDALHYLFSEEQGKIVAHCLDLDLVAVGKDRLTAEYRLNAVVCAQIAGAYTAGNYAVLFSRAPHEYWRTMSQAESLPISTLEIETSPPVVLPEASVLRMELPVFRAVSVSP